MSKQIKCSNAGPSCFGFRHCFRHSSFIISVFTWACGGGVRGLVRLFQHAGGFRRGDVFETAGFVGFVSHAEDAASGRLVGRRLLRRRIGFALQVLVKSLGEDGAHDGENRGADERLAVAGRPA